MFQFTIWNISHILIRISTIFFKWFLIHSPLYSLITHSGDLMHKKYLITRGVISKKSYYSALWKLSSTKALKKGGRTMTKIVHSAFWLKFSKQVWFQPSFYDIKVIKLHFFIDVIYDDEVQIDIISLYNNNEPKKGSHFISYHVSWSYLIK